MEPRLLLAGLLVAMLLLVGMLVIRRVRGRESARTDWGSRKHDSNQLSRALQGEASRLDRGLADDVAANIGF